MKTLEEDCLHLSACRMHLSACNGSSPASCSRQRCKELPSDGQAQTEAPPCLRRQPRETGGQGKFGKEGGQALLNRATHRPTGLKSGGAPTRVRTLHERLLGQWMEGGTGCGSEFRGSWWTRGPCLPKTCLSRRINGCVCGMVWMVDGWMMEGWTACCLVHSQQQQHPEPVRGLAFAPDRPTL